MGMKLRFAHIVGAAAVMVVLLLAPSVASAHAGHHPAPVPVAHHVTPPENDVPEQAAPSNSGCPGSCCAGTPCTACCAVAVSDLAASIPPSLSSALTLPDSNTSDSLDPDGLRRPPRFFA
jgi:hypothetical protein